MEPITDETPLFWVQSENIPRLRRVYTAFLNYGVLIVLLLLTAATLIFFLIIPSILSLVSQLFRPNSLKTTWDSLNLVLVAFAILCGFLGRKKDNPELGSPPIPKDRENPSNHTDLNVPVLLRRNSSSYPDLRIRYGHDDPCRFWEDSREIRKHARTRTYDWNNVEELMEDETNKVEEDLKCVEDWPWPPGSFHMEELKSTPSPRRTKQDLRDLKSKNKWKPKSASKSYRLNVSQVSKVTRSVQRAKLEGSKRGDWSSNKGFLNSLSNQRKKKKKHVSLGNLDMLFSPSNSSSTIPEPPPPPPHSLFQHLFLSKKSKTKKSHISSNFQALKASSSESIGIITHVGDDNASSGGSSPYNLIPPPPPLPPFRVPDWKFKKMEGGDFVRLLSWRSGLSDQDHSEEEPSAVFFPSPDVDTKADSFIRNFKAGLKLEKMNSISEKKQGVGLSGLGPLLRN